MSDDKCMCIFPCVLFAWIVIIDVVQQIYSEYSKSHKISRLLRWQRHTSPKKKYQPKNKLNKDARCKRKSKYLLLT